MTSLTDRLRALRIESAERDAGVRLAPDRYRAAAEALDWHRRWDTVFEQHPDRPWEFSYFAGGMTNVCENALDHHVAAGRDDAELQRAVREGKGAVARSRARRAARTSAGC